MREAAYKTGQAVAVPQTLTQDAAQGYVDSTTKQNPNPFNR